MAALAEKYSRCVHNNKQEDKKDQHNNISEEKTDVVYASLEKVSSDVGQTCTGAHKDISSSPEGKLVSEDDAKQTLEGCDRMTHGNTEITQKTGVKRKHLSDEEVKRSKLTLEDTKMLEVKPPFDRVIIIDSTWNQTKRISSDERLKGLACIELKTRHSNFWRHQKDIPSTYLSTIEAIYYFLRDYHDVFVACDEYDGRYDNLLFFFTFMYSKIRNMYNGGKNLKAYTQRKDNGKSESKE